MNNFSGDFGSGRMAAASSAVASISPSSQDSSSSLPFAQINVKPQTRQKTLKLNPPAVPLHVTFSTLKPFSTQINLAPRKSSDHPILTNFATIGLIECFSSYDPAFAYDKSLNPRRVLTKPSRPVHNNGHDNEKWDYILYVNDVIGNEEGRKYVILDLLGQGTFGQVVKCINLKTRELCAVKVIKNQPAYFNQSMMEVTVLEMLNQKYDREDRRHIVRMKDTFIFRQHLCIVVELLSLNLYDLIKQNGYRGFSLGLCRVFLAQTLDALTVLKEARIIHCDLKPENILLKSLEAPIIKVIDYGSACHEHQTVYTYIQSRFYRSPEIILGLPYTSSIDMWSVGCIAAELFLGLPIFPGCSNYDQISRIVESLGLPPHHMLEMGKDSLTYFDKFPNQPPGRGYALKTRERYSFETGRNEPVPKKYFSITTFPQIILNYPIRSSKEISPVEREAEMANRRCFADFVGGLLNLNPLERWNPYQAMQHPFITGKPFTGPFQPALLPLLSSPSANPPIINQSKQQTPVTTNVQPNRSRPRSNTLSTLTFQDVPPQLQRLAAVSKAQAAQPPAPASQRTVPDEPMSSYDGPALFDQRRNSHVTNSISNPNTSNSTNSTNSNNASRASPRNHQSSQLPANPQIQAHQKLSAYMTNRRVSNPAGMVPYAAASGSINGAHPPHPSSLPTSTGFFYYNNSNNTPVITNNSPNLANMGRRNSRASSQLSITNQNHSSSSSFGVIHRIDEDATMTTEHDEEDDEEMSSSFNSLNASDEEDDEIFQNFETDDDELKDQMDHVTMEETSKRQRKRT